MSWRERAQPVPQEGASWRSRATPVAQQQVAPKAPEEQSTLSKIGQTLKDTAISAVTPIAPATMPKKGTAEYQKVIEGAPSIQEIGQAIKERPVETAVGAVAPVLTVGGAALGGIPGAIGGLGLATGAQRAAQEADKALFEATGGAVGRKAGVETENEIRNLAQILAEQTIAAAIPAGAAKLRGAVAGQRVAQLEKKIAALEPKVAGNPVAQRQLAQLREQAAKIGTSGAQTAAKLGDEQIFKFNGTRVDEAAKAIKGDSWEANTFAGTLTAGTGSDFGAQANILSGIGGKLNKANQQRLLEIAKKDTEAYTKALLPATNKYKSLDVIKKDLDTRFAASQEVLRTSQKLKARQVFAPEQAKTPITGSQLLSVFNEPDVVASMAEGGFGNKLNNIVSSIPRSQALTTKDIAQVMSTIQSQFVSRDDDAARAAFYRTVFPRLKSVFQAAADAPSGAATKTYSKAVIDYFDNRFGLADLGGDFAKTIFENKPADVLRQIGTREGFTQAKKVFDQFGDEKAFGDYLRVVISEASKDAQGQPQAHLLNQVLQNLNTDVPELSKALGAEYIKQLRNLQTVLNAEAIDGTKAQFMAIASGRTQEQAREVSQELKSLALNSAAGNTLGVGSAQANIGRSVIGNALQPDIGSTTVGQTASRRFASEITNPAQSVIAAGAATQAGVPLATGYQSQEDAQQRALQKLQELEAISKGKLDGRGGGPEEAAPSMGAERNLDTLLAPNDEIQQIINQDDLSTLIENTTSYDELDMLIRQAMLEEEPKVTKVLGTRNEEGFRGRVYKDTVGKRTVGIGFNMDAPGAKQRWEQSGVKTSFEDVLAGRKTISKAEAEALYQNDKKTFTNAATKLVKNFGELGQHQQAALIDMVYQLGPAGAMSFARTRALIEKGDFAGAARAMLASQNAKQTPNRVKRRAYMLQHNVSLKEANDALVKAGQIAAKDSIA